MVDGVLGGLVGGDGYMVVMIMIWKLLERALMPRVIRLRTLCWKCVKSGLM